MKKYIIIHGEPGTGKTVNAKALKECFNCNHVFDAGFDDHQIKHASGRILILSPTAKVRDPSDRRRFLKNTECVSVETAKVILGKRWIGAKAA